MYDHDRKNHDQDRIRTHALEAGERRQGYVIAPYSLSLTSFMRAPDYPIPSGFTDYKLSPLQAELAAKRRADRARSGRRGPEVVVVLLPANLVPGAVTVTQFMSRPDIPLPASFESAEERAAYGRPRVSEPERPEDRAIRELLDKELASWAEEQAAETAALEARGLVVRAPAGEASPGHAGAGAVPAHSDAAVEASGVNSVGSRDEKPRADELAHATTDAQRKGGRDGGMGGEDPGVREDGGVKEHAPAPKTAAPAAVETAGPAPRSHAGPSARPQLLSDDRAIQLLLEGVDGSQSARHERVDPGFADVVAAARADRATLANKPDVSLHAPMTTRAMQGQPARIRQHADASTAYAFSEYHEHDDVEHDELAAAAARAQANHDVLGGRESWAQNAMTVEPPQHVESPRLGFDDYRVHGLQELLQRLGPGHARKDTLAAATDADRSIAWRAKGWLESLPDVPTPTQNGRALWRAAERHAATLFRHAVGCGLVDATDPAVEAALQQRGAGEVLPLELRRAMERELGVELEGVRLHTDAVASEAARALGAEAFTVGEDIFFAAGMFSPDTRLGRQLLAHELTHVAQALRGHVHAAGEGLQVSQPGEPLEQEADAIARRIDAAPMPTAGGPEPSGREQRSDHSASAPASRAPLSTLVLRAPAKAAPAKLEFPYAVHITAIIDSDHLLLEFIKQYRGVQTDADAAALRDKERWHWHSTQPHVTQTDVVKGYVLVTVTDASIKPSTASEKKERAQHFKRLPPGDQAAINAQADQEFWDKTRFRVGQQLGSSADDQRMAGTWQLLRDELIRKREAIDALPPDLRKFLFDDQAPKLAPKDYDAALSIIAKIAALTPAELAEYKSRVTAKTTDWTVYEQSIDRFVTERGVREVAAGERRTSETRLALLEPLYERYRKYRSMLTTSAAAAAVGAANPQGAGASLGMQPTLNKMQVELNADLVKAGFPGGITDFEQLIHQYETQFERETLAIANVMLDQYAHTLFVQEEGYRASGQPLYQAVTGGQARADYDEADKIRSEHATGIVLTPGEMADQAHWVGKRNEALAHGDAKMRNVGAAHPLVNNSDFDRQALARVSSETEAQSLMLGYIAARKQDIADTRTNLTAKPTMIYHLDALMQASFRAQNIQSGSIYDRIIHDHISDVHFAEAIPQFILAAIAIAAGAFTGGTGTVAVLGAGTALGIGAYQAVEEFRRYEAQSAAYGAQLTSDDPTMAWVVVAVIGAGIDAAVFASVLPKLRPALAAFNAGAEANDVAALERKLAKLGEVEDGVKQSIIRAAEAETEARAAWKAAFHPTAALRAVIVPGAEEFGRFVYAVYLTIKRGIREFQVFVKTNEALDLIGDVAKLGAEDLAALKTGYIEAIKELEDVARHGSKLGMTETEIFGFMNLRGKGKGMSVTDVTAKMDAWAAQKASGVPFAFESAEQFDQFKSVAAAELKKLLKKLDPNAEAYLQGSAVTGMSYKRHLPFDAESDLDVAISSRYLFRQAEKLGYEAKLSPRRIGPLKLEDANNLGLGKLGKRLRDAVSPADATVGNTASERTVNFMLFDNAEAVTKPIGAASTETTRAAVPLTGD